MAEGCYFLCLGHGQWWGRAVSDPPPLSVSPLTTSLSAVPGCVPPTELLCEVGPGAGRRLSLDPRLLGVSAKLLRLIWCLYSTGFSVCSARVSCWQSALPLLPCGSILYVWSHQNNDKVPITCGKFYSSIQLAGVTGRTHSIACAENISRPERSPGLHRHFTEKVITWIALELFPWSFCDILGTADITLEIKMLPRVFYKMTLKF